METDEFMTVEHTEPVPIAPAPAPKLTEKSAHGIKFKLIGLFKEGEKRLKDSLKERQDAEKIRKAAYNKAYQEAEAQELVDKAKRDAHDKYHPKPAEKRKVDSILEGSPWTQGRKEARPRYINPFEVSIFDEYGGRSKHDKI